MEAPLQYILVAAATTAFSIGAYRAFNRSPSIAKRPPGPKGLPLLGNVLQVPGQHLATYFRSLCEEYGGLVSLNLAGFPVILIGDIKAAKDILDKRSAKFSSRPIVPYVRNHVDPTQSYWGICEAGETHLIARRLTANLMSAVRGGKTEALQEFETLLTTINLLNDGGKNWFHQVNRTSASSVLTVAFGLHCPTGDELDLKEVLHCIEEFVSLCTPSASIINVLPFLDRLPGPKPWRKRAKAYREREDALYKKLVAEAVSGKASDMNTWAAHFAKKDKPEGDQSRLMNQFTGAAIETTAVAMQSFVLACLLYPEWIPRAQQEIDSVVGSDRMPSFKDRPYLPYVESIMRETLRWRPAARFGVPHQSTADDVVEYQGQQYFIPKGSIIFAVAWAMEHDSDKFDDCDRFKPDRFLDEEGKLKSGYETSAFGFGRRVCPGAPFAERSLWIGIAMFLWTFNIKKSEQVNSKTGLPFKYDSSDAAFSGEFSNAPFEFPAVFQPRSMMHEEVARREWAECEKDLTALLPQPTEK